MQQAFGWLRNATLMAVYLARDAVRSVRENWGIGVLSIALAVSLWVFVTDREDAERTGTVPGAVPIEAVNVPADRAVANLSAESVSVRARAPDSIFDGLNADDFRATVDLSGATGERVRVSVQVASQHARAEVLDFSPREITVTLAPVISRGVPVEVHTIGGLPRGLRLGTVETDVSEAIVTGPQDLVADVQVVEADVNLTGANTDFEQRVTLQARDASGRSIQGVTIDPESAVVRVEITQVEFSAAFIVRPEITGTPAAGFNVTAIEVEPAFVLISGPADVFQGLDRLLGVSTDPVSVDGASADVVRTVALRLPEGATVEEPAVTVRVRIGPAPSTFTFSVGLQFTNVPSGLSASASQPTVQVVLAGTAPVLNALGPEDIRATVNLQGLQAGQHEVNVQVQAPSGTQVRSVTPPQVTVTLAP